MSSYSMDGCFSSWHSRSDNSRILCSFEPCGETTDQRFTRPRRTTSEIDWNLRRTDQRFAKRDIVHNSRWLTIWWAECSWYKQTWTRTSGNDLWGACFCNKLTWRNISNSCLWNLSVQRGLVLQIPQFAMSRGLIFWSSTRASMMARPDTG